MRVLERIKTLKEELPNILERVLQRYETQIEELQKAQLAMGAKSDNTFLPPYSKTTLRIKKEENRTVKGKLIALYDYGDFWKGIFSEVGGGMLKISSTDEKTQMLIGRYSENIFGLNKNSIIWLRKKIIKDVQGDVMRWLKS